MFIVAPGEQSLVRVSHEGKYLRLFRAMFLSCAGAEKKVSYRGSVLCLLIAARGSTSVNFFEILSARAMSLPRDFRGSGGGLCVVWEVVMGLRGNFEF